MKIHKLSNILALPFILMIMVIGYFVFKDTNSNLLIWALVPLIPLVLIYLFSPQIDYWWISRNPVELDAPIVNMLVKTNPIYNKLEGSQKEEFDKRLVLFMEGRDFSGKGMESDMRGVPVDIKSMIAQIPVTMTLKRAKTGFKNWERIVLYKHPFPSPRYRFLHTMETFKEDGVIILSLEHVEKALIQKGHHYDVAWHAYAEVFVKDNPSEPYPILPEDIWQKIEQISPQSQAQILATLGFQSVDPMPVLINLYFNQKEKFGVVLPEISRSFDSIFNQ